MDKLIQLCFRSIIRNISGDMELSKKYEELATEIFEVKQSKDKCMYKIEDHIPKQVKKKLYEMVS